MDKKKLYTVDWENTSGFVELDRYKIPLPKMPPLEEMENYGLPLKEQKFKKTEIPSSLLKRKAIVEGSDEEAFIMNEFHKIHNGIWIIIKGEPIYLTGAYYFFLNYWTTNQGAKPGFRLIQCHIFLIWEMVIYDKNSYGLFLVKPRRIGGTEITIEWLYVDVLRYRNMVCGMQSKNEDSVFKNYRRILNAHKNMIWFMKPINQGSSGNKEGLFLRYPEEMQTAKKLKDAAENGERESVYEDPEINSDLTYQPSVATAYDGERLDRYILNEFGKCLAKGTKVLMSSGELKCVEDIVEGDSLMGEDGTPRIVKSLIYGNGDLYKITPKAKGWNEWTCSINHILSLKYCANNYKRWKKGEIVNLTITEFLELPIWVQQMFCLYRGYANYDEKETEIDPYLLGLWIGDGNRCTTSIANVDTEVIEYFKDFASKNNYSLKLDGISYYFSSNDTGKFKNKFRNALFNSNLIKNKHIPNEYLYNSREKRLDLLAGLIDSDGYLNKKKNAYEITQVNKDIAYSIQTLARQLGFKSNIKIKKTSMKRQDGTYFLSTAYRIGIFGYNLYEIPCKVLRKKAERVLDKHLNARDSLKTCFSISKVDDGAYYGFEFYGEKKCHLLEDMQVVHNCEKMSVTDCWDKVKPCLHLDNGLLITGKAVCESTIEEINDEQIGELVEMWNDSNIENRDENGRTTSGLYSLFINALDAAKEDEWGFPKREETLKFLENQFEALKKAGKTKELANLKRKVPILIEDALTPSGDQCAFNKENLQEALSEIDFPDKKDRKPTVVGNLIWENGIFDSRVIFEPNPNGIFEFSVLPGPDTYRDNAVEYYGIEKIPGNVNIIRIGVDPYDHKEVVDNRKSKGGAVGGLMYDDLKDGAKVGPDGRPFDLAKDFETFKPIFTYYHRRDDPQDFFEDMLMACVFTGAPMLFENNKQSIRNHFYNRGYKNFVMSRPEGTMSASQRQQSIVDGIPASENTIQQYYDAIDTYVSRHAKAIKHRNLIVDLLAMNRSNHGKHDLGVAFGWLLIAMTKKYPTPKTNTNQEEEVWYETYNI